MAPQIGRIALVFIAFTGIFLTVKAQLTPPGFGEEGFHRVEAPDVIAARELKHAGMKACLDCHPDIPKISTHVSNGVHCESCHGPSAKHVEDWESQKPYLPKGRTDCGTCHAKIVSRPPDFPQVDLNEHYRDSACISCHVIHDHDLEGKGEDSQ